MPLFGRKSDEERQAEEAARRTAEQAQAAQQESIRQLELGGIPVEAQRRLSTVRAEGHRRFTSDLSVDEFVLARQAGYQPITQVMGSSVYHVGWQSTPGRNFWSYGSQELSVVSRAMNHARELALGRMEQEARLAGADAVVGVHVTRANYDWGKDLIEFMAVGTAVRFRDASPAEHPALTNLSGQDFWKLYSSGYWPVGVVAASTVFYVVASWRTQMANTRFWGSGRANQELQDFTAGLYAARHIAMNHIHQQAARLGGRGVVGMQIEQEEKEYEVNLGNDQERTDMIFTFHAIGTAIAERGGTQPTAETATVVSLDT